MQTLDAIRTMDGEALTTLAYELGLAPAGVQPTTNIFGQARRYITNAWVQTGYDFWEPQTNLGQAEAVFRQLPTKGWYTNYLRDPHGGYVAAWRCHYETGVLTVDFSPETEAVALLRCAVLAMAREQAHRD